MSLGIWELMLILAIVFVLFGAGKLPQVMNDLGKGIKNLKNGLKNEEIKNNLNKEESFKNQAPEKTSSGNIDKNL